MRLPVVPQILKENEFLRCPELLNLWKPFKNHADSVMTTEGLATFGFKGGRIIRNCY